MSQHDHHILIVSGGAGTSAEQVVHTVLAQFPDSLVQVSTVSNVRFESQVDVAIERAWQTGATLVHTMVDSGLRTYLERQADQYGVQAIDLMGALLEQLSQALGRPALGQPGLYRRLNKAYFDRVAAIEYTLAHDDGQRPEGWTAPGISPAAPQQLGVSGTSDYTDPEKVFIELKEAKQLYKRDGFHPIQVTDKPIEFTTDEIIRWIIKISPT